MIDRSPGAQAVADLEIDDVFLLSSTCFVDKSFNPTEPRDSGLYAHRIGVGSEAVLQTRTPVDESQDTIYLIRYIVRGEIYFLKKDANANRDMTEIPDEDTFGRIMLEFAADYRCSKEHHERQECIGAFGRNAIFHVWPFWREGVADVGSRMRLPRITVPMLKPKPQSDYYISTAQEAETDSART